MQGHGLGEYLLYTACHVRNLTCRGMTWVNTYFTLHGISETRHAEVRPGQIPTLHCMVCQKPDMQGHGLGEYILYTARYVRNQTGSGVPCVNTYFTLHSMSET